MSTTQIDSNDYNDRTYERATEALEALYRHWEMHGGVSPDTYDESVAIAQALGFRELFARTDDALDYIWDYAQSGAEPAAIAAMHVNRLRALNAI
jgi:hypothetical protein